MDINNLRSELSHVLMLAEDHNQFSSFLMDWFFKKLGNVNIGIWFTEEWRPPELLAYMKYTDEDKSLKDIFENEVIPELIKKECSYSNNKTINGKQYSLAGLQCTYFGETIATIALFRPRSEKNLFTNEMLDFLAMCEPIIVPSLVKVMGWDKKSGKKQKKDKADWWKRREEPPF